MKAKVKNLCFLLAFVPFFMSCNSDDNDSVGSALITFDQTSPVTITDNGNLVVTGSVTSPVGTSIESIDVYCVYTNGSQTNTSTIANINNLTKVDNHSYTFRFTDANSTIAQRINDGTISGIRIRASVRNGDTSERTLSIRFEDNNGGGTDEKLSAAQNFQWKRIGSNEATGLDQFGLEWTRNSSGGYVIIVRDEATKMVELNSSYFTSSTTTKNNLKTAIDNATGITQYDRISTNNGATYNDYLGVLYNDRYYILHIIKSTITSNSTTGTTIVIDGQYKY